MTVPECSPLLARPSAINSRGHWLAGVLLSLMRLTPMHAVSCIVLHIVSQLALLAAVLLPWKLLMILGSDTLPRLLPAFLRGYPADDLAWILGAGALAAFLAYALCEMGIGSVCGRGARSILSRHRKTGLFGSHRELATALYRRLLRSMGAAVSCALIAVWLLLFYPLLLLALATYLCGGLMAARWCKGPARQAWLARQSPQLRANGWWSLGFLYAVGWVVADYSRDSLPDTIVVFISLLLVRQALVLSAHIHRTYGLLEQQRSKAGALFLADIPWQPAAPADDAFQSLLERDRLRDWVGDVFATHVGRPEGEIATQCRLAGGARIISVTASGLAGGHRQSVLLKLYHASREELAQHEGEILRTAGGNWPAPALVADHGVDGHTCLVFRWHADAHWMTAEERAVRLPVIRERLLECELPEDLADRYDRSHPHLAGRLGAVDLAFLETLVPARSAEAFGRLREHWPALQAMLRQMPRQVVIPRLHQQRIGSLEGRPVVCNWSGWRWEPVGAGWPRSAHGQLRAALARAAAGRRALREVIPGQACLAALLYEFDHFMKNKDFAPAVRLIAPLSDALGHGPAAADPETEGGTLVYQR
ncbi:MAG: hypothetical protein QHC78_12585 [Pigmentiphaga sp.]|uniref:hypothetical protein n=1 Tax=Pigmentiphaga sp. TaxID=1977564 RepID=UPI0029ACB5FA|nr:hypothetical protein [Pigmentiphaga sp.]MDX3906518.1 hypothetical protein [Pigmentiphaga sp.]